MGKTLAVRLAEGRHTPNGLIEVRFTGFDGKQVTIAVTPSYADKVCEVFERLRGLPGTTAIEALSPGERSVLRAQAAGEPLRSGRFRVSADPEKGIVYLQVARFDDVSAEIAMDAEMARRLLGHLSRTISAISGQPGPVLQ